MTNRAYSPSMAPEDPIDLTNRIPHSCGGSDVRFLNIRRERKALQEVALVVVRIPAIAVIFVIGKNIFPEGINCTKGLVNRYGRVSEVMHLRQQSAQLRRENQPVSDLLLVHRTSIKLRLCIVNVVPEQLELRNNHVSVAHCPLLVLLDPGSLRAATRSVGETYGSNRADCLNPGSSRSPYVHRGADQFKGRAVNLVWHCEFRSLARCR